MTKILKLDEFLTENNHETKPLGEKYFQFAAAITLYEDYVQGEEKLDKFSPIMILPKNMFKKAEEYGWINRLEKKKIACVISKPNGFVKDDEFEKLLEDNKKSIIIFNDLSSITDYEVTLLKQVGGKKPLVDLKNGKDLKFEGCIVIVTDDIKEMTDQSAAIKARSVVIG